MERLKETLIKGCVTENLWTDKDAFSHILDTLILVQKEHEMQQRGTETLWFM